MFKTYIDLFRRPEAIIGGYLGGLRKRYMNAFSYFTLAIIISGLQALVLKRYFPNAFDEMSLDENSRAINELLMDYQAVVLYATIPILALMAWLVFYTLKKHNYIEQLIVQLYTYSHLSLNIAVVGVLWLLLGLDYGYLTFGSLPLYILYNAYVYKGLYGLGNKSILKRTLLFIGIALAFYIIGIVLFFVAMLIFNLGFFEQFDPNR